MNDIQAFESKVEEHRKMYIASCGENWFEYYFALQSLSKLYSDDGNMDEAVKIIDESVDVLEKRRHLTSVKRRHFASVKKNAITDDLFQQINYWRDRVDSLRECMDDNIIDFIKAVMALCQLLCAANMSNVALLVYDEVFDIISSELFSTLNELDKREMEYLSMVLMTEATLCALETGDEKLARSYCIMALQRIVQQQEKESTIFNWHYVSDMCQKILSC